MCFDCRCRPAPPLWLVNRPKLLVFDTKIDALHLYSTRKVIWCDSEGGRATIVNDTLHKYPWFSRSLALLRSLRLISVYFFIFVVFFSLNLKVHRAVAALSLATVSIIQKTTFVYHVCSILCCVHKNLSDCKRPTRNFCLFSLYSKCSHIVFFTVFSVCVCVYHCLRSTPFFRSVGFSRFYFRIFFFPIRSMAK